MFGKSKDMKGVIASFTSEAKAIAAAQQDLANKKRSEIAAAQVELDAAVAEIKVADAFIANVEALATPASE
ncbi:MAG: hypothetical protein ACRCTP_02300 [Aeromonas popoffii]|uniref:hypothetical protein n=1 Tax=Aeromonas popoffii TaxID=70856 RepID=UPI003F404C0B